MSVITITPTTLAASTRSVDLVGAGSTVTTSDTFEIIADGNTRTLQIFMEELGAGAATVTFNPGDNPPSFLAGLTSAGLVINLATSDLREVMLEPGEFIQADTSTGKVTGSVGLQSVKIYALRVSNEI